MLTLDRRRRDWQRRRERSFGCGRGEGAVAEERERSPRWGEERE
jgi:hypothetical protein